jgi:hypothetical protein
MRVIEIANAFPSFLARRFRFTQWRFDGLLSASKSQSQNLLQ